MILSAAVAIGFARFGEPARVNEASAADLRLWSETLLEPADRLALVAWLAIAVCVAVVALISVRRGRHGGGAATWTLSVLTPLAACLVLTAAAWSEDPYDMWLGFGVVQFLLGAVIAAVALAGATWRRSAAWPISIVLAVVVVAVTIPAWFQVPNTLIDPGHFRFTSDELASVAAGHFPLNDYVPQYTVLLPFALAPLLAWWPGQSAALALFAILALEVLCLAIAVLIPVALGGRRLAPAALIIVLPTAVITMTDGRTPASYFQGFPLRYVLPLVSIAVTAYLLRNQPAVSWRRPWRWLAIGVLLGITALNNSDFGLAAAIAVLAGLVVAVRPLRQGIAAAVLAATAAATVPVGYAAVAWLNGTPVDWSSWLFFARVFGLAGFMNMPLPSYGLHVAVVALAMGVAATGFVLLRGSKRRLSPFRHRQGTILLLLGLWSLGTLPYLAGRSVPAVFVQGYAVLAATMVAAALPLTVIGWRRLGPGQVRPADVSVALLPFLAASVCVAGLFYAVDSATRAPVSPGEPWNRYERMAGQYDQLLAASPLDAEGPTLGVVVAGGAVVQALETSSLTALTYRIPSVAVSSSAGYLYMSRSIDRLQCARPLPADAKYLLLVQTSAESLAEVPECAGYADWSRTRLYRAPASSLGAPKKPLTFALVPITR